MSLEDVDEEIEFINDHGLAKANVRIIMCVTAPRGIMHIYEPLYHLQIGTRYDPKCTCWDNKCEAIKAFMEQHKED